jgi:hypothetical protein
MNVKRVTCQGKIKDIVGRMYERAFWLADIGGNWVLMTRLFSDESKTDEDILKERRLWVIGSGIYKGIDFTGSDLSVWSIFYSLNGVVYMIRTDGNVSRMINYMELGTGTYPHIFRSDILEMYGLLSYDSKKGWGMRFSSDMGAWTNFVIVDKIGEDLKESFINLNTGISLKDFLAIIDYANQQNIGYPMGFLV